MTGKVISNVHSYFGLARDIPVGRVGVSKTGLALIRINSTHVLDLKRGELFDVAGYGDDYTVQPEGTRVELTC